MAGKDKKRILIADSDQELVKKLGGFLSRAGYEVKLSTRGEEALGLATGGERPFDLVITALSLPDLDGMELLRRVKRRSPTTPVVIITSQGSVQRAVEAMREGAADFLSKPSTSELMQELMNTLGDYLFRPPRLRPGTKGGRAIVTGDPRMKKLLEMARAVADSRATVLISGESGTGKELFARFLHENSSRKNGPFVAVNCASLPEGLLESELFGHEKGAFTGAVARKPGKFELADGGTILLDEISEMDIGLQAKLLRVLQEGEVDRVGGKRPVPVDVRVVATTNRDLSQHIAEGKFREDLYYRLNVIPLKVPPLRERGGDVLLLAQHFLERFAKENHKEGLTLSPEAKELLASQKWPGNVRELMNTMERAVLLCQGQVITPQDFLLDDSAWEAREGAPAAASVAAAAQDPLAGLPTKLREAERILINRALDQTEGNRTHAAKLLGISVRTLRNKLNEYKKQAQAAGA